MITVAMLHEYMPDELVGLSVLEKTNGCAANNKVLEILTRENRLLAKIIIISTALLEKQDSCCFSCDGSMVRFL